MDRVRLTIDIRETACSEAFPEEPKEALDIGDIMISIDGNPVWLFERKSVADMAASISDGRYREQKKRYLSWRQESSGRRVYYIVEGFGGYAPSTDPWHLPRGRGGITTSAIIGSVLNTHFRDDIPVIHTHSTSDTNAMLEELLTRLRKDPSIYMQLQETSEYTDGLKMKRNKNITHENILTLQLCQIPGVSNKIASAITACHTSMASLIKHLEGLADEQSRIVYIRDLKCDAARRVGPKTAANIIAFLYHT